MTEKGPPGLMIWGFGEENMKGKYTFEYLRDWILC